MKRYLVDILIIFDFDKIFGVSMISFNVNSIKKFHKVEFNFL